MVKKNRKNTVDDLLKEPLAIIGVNCQFPGVALDVEDLDAFYEMLLKGQTPIREVPKNRWNIDEYYDPDRKKADKIITRCGGFLNDVHLFDTEYFNISPPEAKQMDPQHRLFLEVSIRALNHANIRLDSLSNSNTGVYCGITSDDYSHLNHKDNIKFNAYTQIGVANSAAAGRLSYFLNLKGPSIAVDTSCSSSFAALYLAATALRTQQCDMAIVGGVHLNLCPENYISLTKANMLSATGKCHSFDDAADGFVRSEGCGVVIVKRLSDALKEHDRIYAVIKSIVMNQDGDRPGLTAPNQESQIAMHQAALEQANLSAEDIDYIEAHGTGTVIGDSIEFNAIQYVHQNHHSQDKPLIIGALKSNLGHNIASSGIASLIKVIAALKNEIIPPNLHYSTPNKLINPQSIPALLPVKAVQFNKKKNKKRRVQVSNFGFIGTNVSAIVEEPPNVALKEVISDDKKPQCFVISAKSEFSLKQMLIQYIPFLKKSSASLRDICYTLINCRDHFKFRCAIIVKNKDELIQKIASEDYKVQKVVIKKDIKAMINDTNKLLESYLSGDNIRLDIKDELYNKADLPLYHFDRKPYWHEPRKANHNFHWLDALHYQSKEQQVDAIKLMLATQIQIILKKESLDQYQDFESLGLTEPLLKELNRVLQELFAERYEINSTLVSAHFTLDKLARHLHQIIFPVTVQRQPLINVLNPEPIAIIGMSCRLPKAANIDEFLSLLERGEHGMIDIPLERWDNEKYYDPDPDALGRLYIKQLGLIDNVRNFDADFFNISPREAKLMSPQLRVFMEASYHALEDANLSLDSIKDSNTGVFVGCGTNEYPRVLGSLGVNLEDLNIYFATGNVLNALAGRIAYSFDFHGPIQAIDTACSSSMTAIHNACLSLQSGDCTMALAGGVNILLVPESNVTLSKARMLSPESRCKTFSEDADGYARSEGCGLVVLKRLSTAIQDNDTILAVIKGTSINSDGKSGGFTVPNGAAQEEVIRSALAKAKLSPGDIDYIEAHGTGTPVADPIEANTLVNIFGEQHNKDKPLYISSVKTNIGHCESASGVAGIIKAVLSLQTHKIFKHLNFKKLNPWIELKNTVIPLSTIDWPKEHDLRYAGVSSFGFSGANAHIILQEAPVKNREVRSLPQESLLVLSAKSKTALELLLASYQKYLSKTKEEFADICFTAATCRSHFLFRVAIKASTAQQAADIIARNEFSIHQIKKEKEPNQKPDTLEQLQIAYQNGNIINWADFYKSLDCKFIKVKLPLYEFARVEHWFLGKDKLKDAPLPKDWCYQLEWQSQPCDKSNRKIQGNNWLLIGAKQLSAGFKDRGLNIVLEEDQYKLEQLSGIIFATGLDTTSPTDIDANIEVQKNLIKKLLGLIKELHQKAITLRLIVLTTNGIAELAAGKLNLSNSPLVGFCKTLVLELPQFNTVLIDLNSAEDGLGVGQVVDEINHNHGQHYEHMIAYRDGKRLAGRLKRTVLKDKRKSLEGKGRYLITGGCGGLGLITAQALLSAGARELILTSRNVEKPAVKAAIKKIQSDYTGRIVRTISLDVSDKEKLANVLADLNTDGLLKGIIHAAGAAIKAPLIEHSDQDVDYLFSAKVKGGWYLHELSQQCELDFFVVYSSISSVFGSNKESVYSATNSFLDVLIAERQRLGLVGTAIQWGPWGEVGMANKRSRDQGLQQALINNEQGHALIKVLINGELNHASIISPDYLKFMLDFVPRPMPLFYNVLAEDLTVGEQSVNAHLSQWLDEYLEVSEDKRFAACKDMLSGICKQILEISPTDDLDEDEGFFEIGFDSLMITEMASELKTRLEPTLKVTVNIGFNYPSINKLSKYIEGELDNNLIKKHGMKLSAKSGEDDIAIIGMSCILPNAPDITAFETMLEQGLSGIKDIPIERWDNSKYYDPNMDAPGKSYVNKLGLIENIKDFDASFFGISPREAKLMEPQQRIFLECCYKALENANYTPDSLRGSLTGVFAGVGPNEYYALLEKSGFSNEELSAYSITGNVLNLIPGRVAYTFDFRGPSLSIDTACSSSLVAIHYACNSLKNRETDYALAGGVNILLMPESNVTLCKAKALSPDGQCKTFDEQADGYARAEGCGVILLKRVADAVRDKDTILAVIKASAVNNDGKSAGLTVPNGKSQEEVMMTALSHSQLSSSDISYIEAHGTGTPLGDPIEVHAINNVYGSKRNKDNPLFLGTVKTNIGHLESASGIAGIIKTVISLRKNKIYKILNFHHLNPNIKLNDTRIAVQNIEWNTNAKLKSAGVNAFGFSGTNAHIILQEFPDAATQRTAKSARLYVLLLSAKSQTALDSLVMRYCQFLASTPDDFSDICFTAATCREHYDYRLALAAENPVQASQLLETGQYAVSHGKNNTLELQDDIELNTLVINYLQGKQVDWSLYYKNLSDEFLKVTLPNYTFYRSEFWPDKKSASIVQANGGHPLLGQMISLPGNEYLFNHQLDLEHLNYIKQHIILGKLIFPATAYIEAGLAAAKSVFKSNSFCIEQFNIQRPLYPRQNQDFQLQVKPKDDERYKITIVAKQNDNWQLFSEMEIAPVSSSTSEFSDIEALKSSFGNRVEMSQIYDQVKNKSLLSGDVFQAIQEGYVTSDSVLTKVTLTKTSSGLGYYYHPILLDGAMKSILLLNTSNDENSTYIPYAFIRMTTYQEAPRSIWVHFIKGEAEIASDLCFDVKIYNNSGLLIGDIEGLKLRLVTRNNFISYESSLQHLYYTRWSPLNLNEPIQADIPELLVIAKDKNKAHHLLGNLNYQLISDISTLPSTADKHIVFLYDQGQFYDLFHCCQTLFKSCPQTFLLVTENAYAVNEHDKVNPYQTMASAFWKSFRNELELNSNYSIDIDANSSLITVLKYIFQAKHVENQFAIRDSIYIPRLKKKQMSLNPAQQASLFKGDASYLITGATGGLAKPLIEYLIRKGVKHIIITSRSACPMEIMTLIERANQQQVSIRHVQADASNYQQMEQVIKDIQQSANPLKGVFHLAGVVHDGLIVNLSDDEVQSVLNAKMESALIVHQLTKNILLELFVLFSSSASLLGARGQSNYVAANGFLDGLAHLRHQQGLPALAINWGPFLSIGMTAKLTQALQQHGFIPLDEENIDVLDVLLTSGLAQISPCPIHWDVYFKYVPKQIWLSELIKSSPPPNQHFLNALRPHSREERVIILGNALRDITADVLALDDVEQVPSTADLFSLGMDSLMSLEIRNRIHDKLQCSTLSLPIEYFINDPSIDKIAKIIADELQTILDKDADQLLLSTTITGQEIPLCDFQYLFWVVNKLGYSFNIGMQLQIHGRLNKEFLFQAFDFVVKQHNAFWINFNEEVPTQTLKKEGQFKLLYQDISLSNEADVLHNEFYNNLISIIPLTQQPLIKVCLYKINNDLHELHLLIPHIIVDDVSVEIIFSQLKASYEALTLGKKLMHTPETSSYFDFVKANNLHYEKNLNNKIDFWQEYNKEFKLLDFSAYHVPDTTRQPKHLFHSPIMAEHVDHFIAWHKTKNINVSTGLVALCQIIFYKMCRQNKIPVILIHSGREGSQYKSVVGLFSEYKRLNITLNKEDKFIDFIQSIEEQLLKTAPYQKCSHFIKDSGLKGSRLSVGQYVTYKFNQLFLTKSFSESKINKTLIGYYLEYLSQLVFNSKKIAFKQRIKTLFRLKMPVQKPEGLRVLLSITPSFFSKVQQERRFADLEYNFASHFGCMDRPANNRTLWIYFSKNQDGEYLFSINGPLTVECKNQIAAEFNDIIAKFVKNKEFNIIDLLR